MNGDLVFVILPCGIAFLAGVVLTLVVLERSTAAREQRQAVRQRELVEFSEFVDAQLHALAVVEDDLARSEAGTGQPTS